MLNRCFTHQNNKNNLSIIVFWYNQNRQKNEYIIMQLAVIDDLIQESKSH